MLTPLLIVWAGLTLILILLLIYRGTLSMHEDDQIFLDDANAHLAKEQEELARKMDRLQPWVRACGAASALLIVVIAGMELYSRMTR
jgi:hypothetical protein